MKRPLLVLLLILVLPGCAVTKATLEGHDTIEGAVANLRVGIDEYHADDGERIAQVKKKLAAAFAKDIVVIAKAGGDEAQLASKVDQLMAALDKVEVAVEVERTRYQNLKNTCRAIEDVNMALRNLAQIKLGWQSEAVEYANKLREKLVQEGK